MAGKFFKVAQLSNWLGRLLVIAILLCVNLLSGLLTTVQAAPAPPPGRGGGVGPSANLIFRDMDKIFDPAIGIPGQLLTYTLRIVCDPTGEKGLQGHDAFIELQLIGDQQFVKYNPLKTNWTKRDVPGDTIYIDMGTVNPGDDGTIQLVTMAPSNLNKTIMEQGIYINWQDNYQYHHRGFTLLLPLKAAMPGPIAPPPDPIGSPLPTDLPTTGPFARQPAPSASQPNTVLNWYLAATGHNLGGDFLSYWLEHGSVQVLGYPISELFKEPESNLVLQYFERGVMEYHPENNPPYQVLLKSLGSELNKATPSVTSDNPPSPDSVYYPDTGHWLDGRFVSYWQKNGGLDQFGYPISEPKIEGNRLIQWTERARFEVDINTNFIPLAQLGLVGNEFAQFKGYLPKPAAGG